MPRYEGYLICSSAGNIKLLKKPICRPNEVSVPIAFNLPKAMFERPTVNMRVAIEPWQPLAVTTEMKIKAQEILEKELGIRIELSVQESTCPYCKGTGFIDDDRAGVHEPCLTCEGTGLLKGARS